MPRGWRARMRGVRDAALRRLATRGRTGRSGPAARRFSPKSEQYHGLDGWLWYCSRFGENRGSNSPNSEQYHEVGVGPWYCSEFGECRARAGLLTDRSGLISVRGEVLGRQVHGNRERYHESQTFLWYRSRFPCKRPQTHRKLERYHGAVLGSWYRSSFSCGSGSVRPLRPAAGFSWPSRRRSRPRCPRCAGRWRPRPRNRKRRARRPLPACSSRRPCA